MDQTPSTPFEALFGAPAPSADVRAEPMHFESVGKSCDFCIEGLVGATHEPAVWAYPCGEAVRKVPLGEFGATVDFPIQAGLWYACARCHRYIKGNGWAALAKAMGFPEGDAGSDMWQAFRVARKKGPGYAWPLVAAKTPDVYPAAANAWRDVVAEYDGEARAALESVRLVTVILGTLYGRTATEETVEYLRDTVGPDVVTRFRGRLGNETNVAVYSDASAA
ncbi:hypothetical protein [Streptomyces sp. 11x1]|uniref:hypothetical protein n=1 Tax=Streptomyces sp. 11x1 TaxID=3038642 RepID=UPI002931CA08|nr:hypothetical protein [Streptomyces sp. 11x1]WNZ14940.1 hypothetical protein P8T65_46740 [Streptomyces sp. 11x1]